MSKRVFTPLLRFVPIALTLVVAAFDSTVARAAEIDVALEGEGTLGKKKPKLIVTINKQVATLDLNLTADGGLAIKKTAKGLRVGQKYTFDLDSPEGRTVWQGALAMKYTDGYEQDMPLDVTVEVFGPKMHIDVPYERMKLSSGHLEMKLPRQVDYCEHDVLVDSKPKISGKTEMRGLAAGTWAPVDWRPYSDSDVVLKITINCFQDSGYSYGGVELFPWWLEIPHDDVVFESGTWDIRSSEDGKLMKALEELAGQVQRYGDLVPMKLYVVGHTDTVGDKGSNQGLSVKRAQAIAQWFRRSGVKIPIQFAGVGEDVPAVPTNDEVDEIRNRRVRYILGVEAQEKLAWKKL